MKKLIICLLAIAILFSFSACSVSESEETTTAYTQPTTAEATTEPETEQTEKATEPIINLTEADAKNAAYEALKEEYSSEYPFGCDYTAFEFSDIKSHNYGENTSYDSFDAVKKSGHSYYVVTYRNTTQEIDFAYFLIDAANGDLLYSGYMGD